MGTCNEYNYVIIHLYGEFTISCSQLSLTSDKMVVWVPLENCIATISIMLAKYKSHAMHFLYDNTFFKQLDPKITHVSEGKNRNLTVEGKHYGMLVNNMFYAFSNLPSLTLGLCFFLLLKG